MKNGDSTGSERRSWARILEQIKNPLGFFALALLIIEAALTSIAIFSDIEPNQKFHIAVLMVGVFALVVLAVAVIAWFLPTHLYEKIADEVRQVQTVKDVVESKALQDFIEQLIAQRDRPDNVLDEKDE